MREICVQNPHLGSYLCSKMCGFIYQLFFLDSSSLEIGEYGTTTEIIFQSSW